MICRKTNSVGRLGRSAAFAILCSLGRTASTATAFAADGHKPSEKRGGWRARARQQICPKGRKLGHRGLQLDCRVAADRS